MWMKTAESIAPIDLRVSGKQLFEFQLQACAQPECSLLKIPAHGVFVRQHLKVG
jgi:hypothetical protein